MACFVYVLAGLSGTRRVTYVGWTLDLERRLAEHNGAAAKGAKSTRGRAWTLVYAEKYQTRSEAMSREAKLKRDRKFRALLRSCEARDFTTWAGASRAAGDQPVSTRNEPKA